MNDWIPEGAYCLLDYVAQDATADDWAHLRKVRKLAMARAEKANGVVLGPITVRQFWEFEEERWKVVAFAEVVG